MKTSRPIKVITLICALVSIRAGAHAEIAIPNSGPDTTGNGFLGTRKYPLATAAEVKCLLEKVGIKSALAQTTAENLTQAVQIMNFDTGKFTRVCLLHFLAQAKKETRDFAALTQEGAQSAASTGYGYMQVTGKANRIEAQKCMNEVSPGMGDGVVNSPQTTIGAKGSPLKSAVASMCWWRQNIINNNEHDRICNTGAADADGKITHVVNGGSLDGAVTQGQKNIAERAGTFKQLQEAEGPCRHYAI